MDGGEATTRRRRCQGVRSQLAGRHGGGAVTFAKSRAKLTTTPAEGHV
jgi:hypothetical protein